MELGPTTLSVLTSLAGLVLLYVGGEGLVRGASSLALAVGMSPLVIGLTVVAFGTSMPEFVVSLDAALSRANDIAVGNVVGSNIANIALILGLTALLRPPRVEAKVVKLDAPLMIVVTGLLIAALADGEVSRLEGGALFTGLIGYTWFTLRKGGWRPRAADPAIPSAEAAAGPRPASNAVLLVVGLLALIGGGHLLVRGAVDLATTAGVSQAVIGLTIVAFGTSLPELATSVIATLKGEGDIAVGNLVGSNVFNILGILGVTALIHPLERGGITSLDLGMMLGVAVFSLLFFTTRLKLARLEGAILLLSFLVYMGSMWGRGP